MAPKLRVLVSTNQAYPPTTLAHVNADHPTRIKTDKFDGEISVFVKDFAGEGKAGDGEAFFGPRAGQTYGIVVRGHFLDGVNGDDVLFGNVFEESIKESLPWGTAVATKFMYFIDPTLELDVYADKPWALSPVLSTMNYLSLKKGGETPSGAAGEFTATQFKPVDEDSLGLVGKPESTTDVSFRRKYFGDPGNREGITLDKDVEVGMEFSNGILDFNTLSVQLPKPFALSFPLLKYWDGQPVTYVCRRRPVGDESPVSADGVYWSVAFEIIDEDATADLEKRGKKARRLSVSSEAGSASDGDADA